MGGWFFGDYRVSPNFLLCWGWVVVEVGLGCDKKLLSLGVNLSLSVKPSRVLSDYVKKPNVDGMLSSALLEELSDYIPVVKCNYTGS